MSPNCSYSIYHKLISVLNPSLGEWHHYSLPSATSWTAGVTFHISLPHPHAHPRLSSNISTVWIFSNVSIYIFSNANPLVWATSTSYQNTFNSLLTRLATTMLRFLQSIHQNAPRATFWKRRSHHVSLLSIICMLKNYSSQYKDKGSSFDPCSSHQPYSMSQLSLSISADQPSLRLSSIFFLYLKNLMLWTYFTDFTTHILSFNNYS